MDFLTTMVNDGLTLKANLNIITNWCIDTIFALHTDKKIHTGACITLGKGAVTSVSTKQER